MSWIRLVLGCCLFVPVAGAFDIGLPTPNRAILAAGHGSEYFQPTASGEEGSGEFGCVRSGGRRFHEGIDIRCRERDRRGEPVDPVVAVSDGRVVLINRRAGLSNYGHYVVLEHRWNGVLLHTLYAHLRRVTRGLQVGNSIRKGQPLGVLGYSTNTRSGITRSRAHLHFEIGLMLNSRFQTWYRRQSPKAPPFGNYNGQNLAGLDPAALLRARAADPRMSFAEYLARQPIGFTVLVAARRFSWLIMQPQQIQPTEAGDGIPIVAYEIGATSWGLPIAVWPRSRGDLTPAQWRVLSRPGRNRGVLHQVNQAELASSNCRGLVRPKKRGQGWELTEKGHRWVELLTFLP